MKKKILFLGVLLLVVIYSSAQTVYYVDAAQPNNDGDGLTWGTAKKEIDKALTIANPITQDEIWVKAGAYGSTNVLDTESGISIYGGFAGQETSKNQRAISDIDANGIVEPWEFTNATVYTSTVNNRAIINITGVIDGMTIVHTVNGISAYTSSVDVVKGGVVQNCIFNNSVISLSNLTANIGGALIDTEGDFINNLVENNTVTIAQTGNQKLVGLLNVEPHNSIYTIEVTGNIFRNNKVAITGLSANETPKNLRGLLLNITGKPSKNEVQFVNNIIHNNEGSYASTGSYATADRAGGVFSILTFSTSETKTTFINNTIANNKFTNLPAVFHIFKGNTKHLFAIHNNVFWSNLLGNSPNGLVSNSAQLPASSITNNFCDVTIGGNVSVGFDNNVTDVSSLNTGAKAPLFGMPTTVSGYANDGSVETSDWRIASESSYFHAGGISIAGVAKDKTGFPYKTPPAVGAYESLPSVATSEINAIRNKYVNWLTGASANYDRPEVMVRYQEFLSSGSRAKDVSDIDFENPGAQWDFSDAGDIAECRTIFESTLIRLAFLYNIRGPLTNQNPDYKSVALKNTLLDIFKFIKDKGVSAATDFGGKLSEESELISVGGTILNRTTAYGTAVLLMKEELKQAGEFAHHMGALNTCSSYLDPELTIFKFTYPGMSADVLRALGQQRFAYILALDEDDPKRIANMEFFQAFMNNGLLVSRGWRDTLKPDFMLYHHRGAYANAYGSQALHVSSILNLMLSGTSYALNAQAQENLFKALMTYNILSYDFELVNGLGGRFPQTTTPLTSLRAAYGFLYLANPTLFLEAGEEFVRLWNLSTSENTVLQKQYKLSISLLYAIGGMEDLMTVVDSGVSPATDKTGHFGFGYGGINIHRYNDFMVSQKGTNKHIWHFENSSSENLFGRYTSAGAMDILVSGDPVSRLASGITDEGKDWAHIPGTTATYMPTQDLKVPGNNDDRDMTSKDFMAHAVLGNYGVFSMDYEDVNAPNKMGALKSSFYFEDKILCLGSNIKNGDAVNPVHTTLFQSYLSAPTDVTYVNDVEVSGVAYDYNQNSGGYWATDAVGNGYIVPDNLYNTGVSHVKRAAQISRDHRDTKDTYGDFVSSWIDHGSDPQNASYQYAVAVQGGRTVTKNIAANFSNYFNVLQQDEVAHIATYIPTSVTGYVVFQPDNLVADDLLMSIDKPAILMAQPVAGESTLKLSLTNPDLGLLATGEHYSYTEINADPSVLNKIPEARVVTIVVKGLWSLAEAQTDVSLTHSDGNTQIDFTTAHGKTIQITLETQDQLSINDRYEGEKVKVYPNPTDGTLTLTGDFTIGKSIKLFTQLGQEVFVSKERIDNGILLDVSQLPTGLYLLCLENTVHKFVKK